MRFDEERSVQRERMGKSRFDAITSNALTRVLGGSGPDRAWVEALRDMYPAELFLSQVKHTCPKWAFCILCHKGYVDEVSAGCCPAAEKSHSAAYTLKALNLLRTNTLLLTNKKELELQVFGKKGEPGFRTPNNEIDVLLALWKSGRLISSLTSRNGI